MSVVYLGSLPLGAINVGIDGAVTLITPLLAQFDLMLTGPFGLASILADLSAQLAAALAAQASLAIQITDPFASLMAQLQAILQLQAGIQAAIALGFPPIVFGISVSASVAISAALALRVGGIQLLINLALSLKLPIIDFLATLNLSAGPLVLLSFGFSGIDTLSSAGTGINALMQAGVGGVLPTDNVEGVVIFTKDPQAAAALAVIIKTQ